MSFDRVAIERHLEDLDRFEPLAAARDLLRACLVEIDRLAKLAEMRGANYDLVINERNEALAQVRRWREKLAEVLDQYEHACQYKGEYLVEKHGDAELIAEGRALLAEMEGR